MLRHELFSLALALTELWFVSDVRLDLADGDKTGVKPEDST